MTPPKTPRRLYAGLTLSICFVLCLAKLAVAETPREVPEYVIATFGAPPEVPDGALPEGVDAAIATILTDSFQQTSWDPADRAAFATIAATKDPRVVWLLVDMMRFTWAIRFDDALVETALAILDIELDTVQRRAEITDHMIAWDIPAYPGYLAHKRAIYTNYLDGTDALFAEGDIAWQLVGWGGVDIDARPYDTTDDICHCIPAIDNPKVSSAEDAEWLSDDAIVFGIAINGAARAYPRRIMEVREMVNDTLGGRDLGIPYCTLCGAAQAYFTDGMPAGVQRPILRTSGLLIRSNKVMYDVNTSSVFDTFLGKAVTGPLAERGIVLDQATVITTTWGDWKTAYPQTTVLVEELALGRDFDLRNTRDANGPIFPVGDVDPRLPVHEDVIGVTLPSGQPVAFPRAAALAALRSGADVRFKDVRLKLDAGGIRAEHVDGADLGSHQAFWFAWSQFHPDTALWAGL